MSNNDEIKQKYPFPVAKLYEVMQLEAEPRQRTRKLVDLFEKTSQYLVLVGLATYIQKGMSEDRVEKLRPGLARPSLGHWVDLLAALSRCLKPYDPNFLTSNSHYNYKNEPIGTAVKIAREIIDLASPKKILLHNFLKTVVEFRNRKIGHGELPLIEAEKIKQPLEEALVQWLGQIATLHKRELIYIAEVQYKNRFYVCTGVHLNKGVSLEPFQMKRNEPVDGEQVCLLSPEDNTLLSLSPFLVYESHAKIVYFYSELANRGDYILRCPYNAPGANQLTFPAGDKFVIIGGESERAADSNDVGTNKDEMESTSIVESLEHEIEREKQDNVLLLHEEKIEKSVDEVVDAITNEERLIKKVKTLRDAWEQFEERIAELYRDQQSEARTQELSHIDNQIRKAKKRQREIEIELNNLESKLAKDDPGTKYQKASKQARESLSIITDLMEDTKIVSAISTYETNFRQASDQIDTVGTYKDIHDQLHTLEFHCYTPLIRELRAYPDSVNYVAIDFYRITFQQLENRIRNLIQKRILPSDESTLLSRLENTENIFTKAIEDRDLGELQHAARSMGRILALHPSGINNNLKTAAASVPLKYLKESLSQIKEHLRRSNIQKELTEILGEGIEGLSKLSDSLDSITLEHDQWQQIDDQLRWVKSNPEEGIEEWIYIKEKIESLCANNTDRWAVEIKKKSKHLDDGISEQVSTKELQERFRACQREISNRFYAIDLQLKDLCDEVRKLEEPIKIIVHKTFL